MKRSVENLTYTLACINVEGNCGLGWWSDKQSMLILTPPIISSGPGSEKHSAQDDIPEAIDSSG